MRFQAIFASKVDTPLAKVQQHYKDGVNGMQFHQREKRSDFEESLNRGRKFCWDNIHLKSWKTLTPINETTAFKDDMTARENMFHKALERHPMGNPKAPENLDETYLVFVNETKPFRYEYWPVSWEKKDGEASSKFLNNDTECRPGGGVQTFFFENPDPDSKFSVFDPAVYGFYGDTNSVELVANETSHKCKAIFATPENNVLNFTVNPRNVLAYYRDGSFALVQHGYDNDRSAEKSARSGQWNDFSGIPSLLSGSDPFGQCVHESILSALPVNYIHSDQIGISGVAALSINVGWTALLSILVALLSFIR